MCDVIEAVLQTTRHCIHYTKYYVSSDAEVLFAFFSPLRYLFHIRIDGTYSLRIR